LNKFLSTIFTSAANVLLTAVQGVLISRILGPAGRGEFQALVFFPTLIASLGILGLNDSIVRLVAGSNFDSNRSFLGPVLKASALSGLLSTLIGVVTIWYLDRLINIEIPSYVFFIFVPINHIGICLLSIDYGRSNYSSYNFGRILLTPVFMILVCFSLFLFPISAFSLSVSLLISNAVVMLQRLVKFRNDFSMPPACSVRELFASGRSFWVASLLSISMTQIDKALILYYFDSQNVGYYVVAFSVSSILGLIGSSVATVVFQKSASSSSDSSALFIFRAFRLCVIISCFISICAIPVLSVLVETVYGIEFSSSGWLAVYLLPAVMIQSLGEILSQYLRGQGRPITVAVGALISLTFTIVFVAVSHVKFQLMSLPIALAISNLLMLMWVAWCCLGKGKFSISVLIPGINDLRAVSRVALNIMGPLSEKT